MAQPLVKNAANKDEVKEAQAKVKLKRDSDLKDLQALLSLPEGRRFIWRVLSMCGLYESSYTGSGSDTFFREGKRQIGLNLLNDIVLADPQAYIQMMQNKGEV